MHQNKVSTLFLVWGTREGSRIKRSKYLPPSYYQFMAGLLNFEANFSSSQKLDKMEHRKTLQAFSVKGTLQRTLLVARKGQS